MSNLLILGAGQFGFMVKEIAESTGEYEKIDYLDDFNPVAIGKLEELSGYANQYEYAIIALGNPDTRQIYFEKAKRHFKMATLISPFAHVSKSSRIGLGAIIEPMAVIQSGSFVGEGCIVSSGAIVRHNAKVGSFCHLDCNSVIMSNMSLPDKTKLACLTVYKNN